MEFKLKIKPTKVVKSTREGIIDSYRLYGFTCSSRYGNYFREDDEYIYAANFQKVNTKTKQVKRRANGMVETDSVILHYAHYVGYVYKFPKALLDLTGKKIEQGRKNFKVVDKKR